MDAQTRSDEEAGEMMKRKMVSFLAAGLATAAIAAPGIVEARWTRTSAMDCLTADMLEPNPVGLNNYGNQTVEAYCPIRDDSEFPKQDIASLTVRGRDDHPGAS